MYIGPVLCFAFVSAIGILVYARTTLLILLYNRVKSLYNFFSTYMHVSRLCCCYLCTTVSCDIFVSSNRIHAELFAFRLEHTAFARKRRPKTATIKHFSHCDRFLHCVRLCRVATTKTNKTTHRAAKFPYNHNAIRIRTYPQHAERSARSHLYGVCLH